VCRVDHDARPYCKFKFQSEVNMLDIFYVAVVIVFFALLWGFTKASERL
jgi:hypothetical protein